MLVRARRAEVERRYWVWVWPWTRGHRRGGQRRRGGQLLLGRRQAGRGGARTVRLSSVSTRRSRRAEGGSVLRGRAGGSPQPGPPQGCLRKTIRPRALGDLQKNLVDLLLLSPRAARPWMTVRRLPTRIAEDIYSFVSEKVFIADGKLDPARYEHMWRLFENVWRRKMIHTTHMKVSWKHKKRRESRPDRGRASSRPGSAVGLRRNIFASSGAQGPGCDGPGLPERAGRAAAAGIRSRMRSRIRVNAATSWLKLGTRILASA